ncbi:unnamed protein product [Psylliodes chrysocephalus]|uniref:Uncharacterized protein n=1 Tax=Psylliodes chrysocephalus TaxID=3402493 RepID=A0A9P0C834_9CUCU|nr:unnamed protein product [Psylliodes chrysocephala]
MIFFRLGAFSTTLKKNICDDKQLLKFSSVTCFRFDSEFPNTMFVKHLFNEEFRSINIGKRGQRSFQNIMQLQLEPKYEESIQINGKKLSNLVQLLPYIPPVYQFFYKNLKGFNNMDLADNADDNDMLEHLDVDDNEID